MGKGLLEQGTVCQMCKKIHPKEEITSVLLIEGLEEVPLCPKCLNLCKAEKFKDRTAIIRRVYGYSEEADRAIAQIPAPSKPANVTIKETAPAPAPIPKNRTATQWAFAIIGLAPFLFLLFLSILYISSAINEGPEYTWDLQLVTILCTVLSLVIYSFSFLRKKNLRPLLVAVLCLLLTAPSAGGLAANINTEYWYSYEVENPDYGKEYTTTTILGEYTWKEPRTITEYKTSESLKILNTVETACSGLLTAMCGVTAITFFTISTVNGIRAASLRRKQSKKFKIDQRDLLAREKVYAKIDKYHEYLQRGAISQEEYEENRRRILETLDVQ